MVQKKKLYNFTVLLEESPDGWFIAKVPDLQGCATQGRTVVQAMERVREAIQVCLEADDVLAPQMKFVGVQQVEVRV